MTPAALPELVTHRSSGRHQAAIIFVHGFGGAPGGNTDGEAQGTFGRLADYLAQRPDISGWDLFSLGYPTRLSLDIRGIWSGDPDLGRLAAYLSNRLTLQPIDGYQAIALVAHSMGGLVVQRALLDDPRLVSRTQHVLLFGTPSGGLRKAAPFAWLKPQMLGMTPRGDFITALRRDWDDTGWNATVQEGNPFSLWIVPGLQDEFVPWSSSSECFPSALRHPILGNHLQIVRPAHPESEPVMTVVAALNGESVQGRIRNSARVAVEAGDFQRVIERWLPHAAELSEPDRIDLALALDSTNRRTEALKLLDNENLGTDAQGTLAGRYKREWWIDRRQQDGDRAWELYADAYTRAANRLDHDQAYYHAINLAFLALTFRRQPSQSRELATDALDHCENATPGMWRWATIGEAYLHHDRSADSIAAYAEALRLNPGPREAASMFQQACWIAEQQRDVLLLNRLTEVFQATVPTEPLDTSTGT